MTKRIALCSLALAALLAGCADSSTLSRGSDGMYVSTPAHPAAPPSQNADRGE